MDNYILDENHNPVCVTFDEWLANNPYADDAKRRVGHDEKDGVLVSTVFLALDHSHGRGKPILFETMIFGGKHDHYEERYCTWDEALEGHKKACELAGVPYVPPAAPHTEGEKK